MLNQMSFDPLDYQDSTVDCAQSDGVYEAKKDRNEVFYRLKAEGKKVRRWVLRGQLRPYASFGVPDGRTRDVYYITIQA